MTVMINPIKTMTWYAINPKTAGDQFLGINKSNGMASCFNQGDDADKVEEWFHWLIIKQPGPNSELYWFFNKAAKDGAGECLSNSKLNNLGQWKFERKAMQEFTIVQHPNSDFADHYLIRNPQRNNEVVSTRWNLPAFLWELVDKDDQQALKIIELKDQFIYNPPADVHEPNDKSLVPDLIWDKPILPRTERLLVGVSEIPFTSVSEDPLLNIGQQMLISPKYHLKRYQYWKNGWSHQNDDDNEHSRVEVHEVGTEEMTETTVEKSTQTTIGFDAKYGTSELAGFGFEGSTTWGEVLTYKAGTQHAERKTVSENITYSPFEGQAYWALVNVYELCRRNVSVGDDEIVVACAEIEEKNHSVLKSCKKPGHG